MKGKGNGGGDTLEDLSLQKLSGDEEHVLAVSSVSIFLESLLGVHWGDKM